MVLVIFNIVSLSLVLWAVANFCIASKRSLPPFRADQPEMFVSVLLLSPLLFFLMTRHNFASRYVLALYPLLFLLPAHYLMDNPAPSRWLNLAKAAMVVTMGFNVVLMLAFFHYQGQRLAHADYFIASFQKMEQARQALRADTANGCGVHLDGVSTTKMGPPEVRGLVALERYVNIYEPFDPAAKNASREELYRILPRAKAPPLMNGLSTAPTD